MSQRALWTLWILLAALLLAPLAWAAAPPPAQQQPAVDPERLYKLTSELRCLVCQNESLADSSADLAMDLKKEIRARMARGESDADIKKFLVDRYGNFVVYRPPFDGRTLLLWLGPLLLAVIGLAALWRTLLANKTGDAETGGIDGAKENAKNGPEEPAA